MCDNFGRVLVYAIQHDLLEEKRKIPCDVCTSGEWVFIYWDREFDLEGRKIEDHPCRNCNYFIEFWSLNISF